MSCAFKADGASRTKKSRARGTIAQEKISTSPFWLLGDGMHFITQLARSNKLVSGLTVKSVGPV